MNIILFIVLILLVCGGFPPLGFHQYVGGYPQYYGGLGGIVLLVAVILLLTGRL